MPVEPSSTPVVYTVTATLPDEPTAARYLDWLVKVHLEEVVRAGAVSASAARLIDPADPVRVESSYVFGGRAEFDRYVAEHAPRLRATGVAVFGPLGVSFERRLARVEACLGPDGAADPRASTPT